jgi:myo-inositol catabolism protein IolS
MEYRRLGQSDVLVSEISLGCWTMGGLSWCEGEPTGWATVDEGEITAAVKRALDAGVNHFDNADIYGNGEAERMLARVFQRLGVRSEDFVIATKMGHVRGTAAHAYEPAHIRHQCEQSLINLRRDYIDLYYLHRGSFGDHDEYLDGAAEALNALVAQGKVRLKGQSAYSAVDFERSVPVVQPEVLQSWANLIDPQFIRHGSPISRLLAEGKLSFVAFSPLGQGVLLGKYNHRNLPEFGLGDHRRDNSQFRAESIARIEPKIERLKERFGSTTADLAAVAQRYVLNHPNVACVIPGFRNERQVACNLEAAQRSLTEEDMNFLYELFADCEPLS